MGIFLWPLAIAAFLAWSLASWLLYGASDWLAGIVGGAMSGIMSEALGSWAQWLMASLGDLIQIGIAAIWAIVGLLILSAPLLVRRMRHKPEFAERRYLPERDMLDARSDRRWHDSNSRSSFKPSRVELDELRFLASEMVEKYRDKRWKKKKKMWDDD